MALIQYVNKRTGDVITVPASIAAFLVSDSSWERVRRNAEPVTETPADETAPVDTAPQEAEPVNDTPAAPARVTRALKGSNRK